MTPDDAKLAEIDKQPNRYFFAPKQAESDVKFLRRLLAERDAELAAALEQAKRVADTRVRVHRNAALEEAAQVSAKLGWTTVAAAIRALKDK